MSKHISGHELAEQIEKLVADFIAASRAAASTAIERAFAGGSKSSQSRARPSPKAQRRTSASARRSPEKMAALSERLYEVICSKPGETMTVLAASAGVTPREMLVPSARLKRAGRIRSVGKKSQTRYFPMLKSASKSS